MPEEGVAQVVVSNIKIGIAVRYLYLDRLAHYCHLTWRAMKYSNEPVGAILWPPHRNHVADFGIALAGILLQAAGLGAATDRLPTIAVQRQLPAPAARPSQPASRAPYLGKIANVTEMTSQSGVGQTCIVLQFGALGLFAQRRGCRSCRRKSSTSATR